ncbi:DUF5810 domain-containing protein [Haloarchaeobius iranensis]|uniref:Uncharacterized protein n=1 Tax=Haloarchaeobius iranensis TaxID=996166 RepID=A0A1G9XTC7_9EURY|nr:DUF5810 domain-containing protein [Haloarchaeobius iranensis]SDM99513.1 hypothetical protein SAMN05192554_111108 [Haloarchaeobius iranensis]
MGYECPVCSVPHADAEHLANHLAFTAMLHGDEHEDWLAEHAPAWESASPESLAPVVADAVPETEFEQVFEDTTDGHDHASFEDAVAEGVRDGNRGSPPTTADHDEVLQEARELTRRMHEDGETDAEDDASDTESE